MKTTIRQHILRRFHTNYKAGKTGWVNAQVIEDILHPIINHKHESIGRELRRLADEGWLEAKEMKIPPYTVASIYYKYLPKIQ